MKNKKVFFIITIIVVLVAAVVLFAVLNAGNLGEKKASQENATVTIVKGDREETFDLVYLKSFEKEEFNAVRDTSKTDPEKKIFGGVELMTVLGDLGFDLSGAKQVTFTAADGYMTAVTAEEVQESGNVYLVYERDGEPSDTKQKGGTGPIEIIVAKDQYSQRWCKFLLEIKIL